MIESSLAPVGSSNYGSSVQFSSQFLPSRARQSPSQSSHEQTSVSDSKNSRWALVVDDVSDVTEMLSVLLTHAGYEVSTAHCARDAIALAREHHFDVIISDIGMPEMNGYEMAEA